MLRSYLGSFDPRIVGLTGSREAVDAAVRAYRAYAKRVPLKEGDYTMEHTSLVYLMDGQGRFVNAFNTSLAARRGGGGGVASPVLRSPGPRRPREAVIGLVPPKGRDEQLDGAAPGRDADEDVVECPLPRAPPPRRQRLRPL